MKITLRELRKNSQGTKSGVNETKNQINDLEHKEEKSIQSEHQEEKRIQKYKYRLRSLWDISKCTNIQILGSPEGKEEEQEIENVYEKILKENFPNLVKEIDFQEAQRVPKKLNPRRNTPRHIIITLPKIKEKERILKSRKRKGDSYIQRSPY